MLKRVIVFFLIALLFGCAGLNSRPEQFKVNISAMQLLESSLMEQRYQVRLRIINQGRDTLHVAGMSFDLKLNDKDFASGVSNEQFKLEPLSDTIVVVSVTSTIFGLIRQVNGLKQLKSKPFKYELSGRIYPDAGMFGIPFKEKGEVNLNH